MSRVLLCGAFGQDNPGDDALLDSFVHALAPHDLLVATPADLHCDVRTVSSSPRAIADALREVDAVVVAGGTVFKSLHPSVPRHHLGLLARTRILLAGAHARGLPFALVGVGAGALRSSTAKRLARTVVTNADLVVLRDEESAAVLRTAGATGPFRIGADPTWTLPGLVRRTAAQPDASAPVVIALSHLAGEDLPRLATQLSTVVTTLASHGVDVHLQPWQSSAGPDHQLARMVTDSLPTSGRVRIIERPTSLADAVRSYAGALAIVGLRHHALVAAGAAGRPFAALSHEPKLAGLARRLDQQWVSPHAPTAVLRAVATALLDQPSPTSMSIDAEVSIAGQAMDLLHVVVAGGENDHLLDRDRLALTNDGTSW